MYSRQGIVRRNRRRTQGATHALQRDTTFSQTSPAKATDPGEVQSHLAPDVDATRKYLSNLQNPENHESSQALSTLVAITSTPNMKPWCHGGTDHLYMFTVYAAEWAESKMALFCDGYSKSDIPFSIRVLYFAKPISE